MQRFAVLLLGAVPLPRVEGTGHAASGASSALRRAKDLRIAEVRGHVHASDILHVEGSADGGRNASFWPRNGEVEDKSLQHTFRGDDFLPQGAHGAYGAEEKATWRSRPHVNECVDSAAMTPEEAHVCDFLSLKFKVVTPAGETEMFWGRDFVSPMSKEQTQRLREGPFRDLLEQKGSPAWRDHKGPQRVTFVVHGYLAWGMTGPGEWQGTLARELVSGGGGDDAAIVVDWTRGAHATWDDCHGMECVDDYSVAMADTRVVGKYVQRLAEGVREVLRSGYSGGTTLRVGCVGHSVGSHACGFAGKYMNAETSLLETDLRLARISALDPAGPSGGAVSSAHTLAGGRSWVDPAYYKARLSPEDADFVDTYFSDPGGFGYDYRVAADDATEVRASDMLGHVNFLVNGEEYAARGDQQPGCDPLLVKQGCSHHVAINSFIETLATRKVEQALSGDATHPTYASNAYLLRVVALSVLVFACCFVCAGAVAGKERAPLVAGGFAVLVLLVLLFFAYVSYTRPSPEDYCAHIVATPRDVERCSLPFVADQSATGTCPERSPVKMVYGICAHQGEARGLYMVSST